MSLDALFSTVRTLRLWSLPIAFVLLVAESGLVVGVALPGISVVVGVGLLCGAGIVPWPVGLAVVVVAAVVGPNAGYWRARRLSVHTVHGPGLRRRLPRPVERALAAAESRPLLALVVGQWFAVARTLVPRVAGPQVSWPRFLVANAPSAAAWSATSFGLGVLVAIGSTVALRLISVQQAVATVLLVALVVAVGAGYARSGSRRRSAG